MLRIFIIIIIIITNLYFTTNSYISFWIHILVEFLSSDLEKTLQMSQKRKLEGRQLTVSKVPISNCLLVENLSDATTEDTIAFYFENKRSNGGPVEKLEMVSGGNKCFVYFESHEGDDNCDIVGS